MLCAVRTLWGGVTAPSEKFTNAGGVKAGDWVYKNSNGVVAIVTTDLDKCIGIATHDAATTETVDVALALPGTVVEVTFTGTYTGVEMLYRNYGIDGATGAQVLDLGDTTHPLMKLIAIKENLTTGTNVAVCTFMPATSQAFTLAAD